MPAMAFSPRYMMSHGDDQIKKKLQGICFIIGHKLYYFKSPFKVSNENLIQSGIQLKAVMF